jgi:hypothetical protein
MCIGAGQRCRVFTKGSWTGKPRRYFDHTDAVWCEDGTAAIHPHARLASRRPEIERTTGVVRHSPR